jgi:hypothetical protein
MGRRRSRAHDEHAFESRLSKSRNRLTPFVGSCALATGAMWRCRTAIAPWAGRDGHTTVIDAAGAIYVIGGETINGVLFDDVWVSTDGGARPDSGGGYTRWVLRGYYRGTTGGWGVLKG